MSEQKTNENKKIKKKQSFKRRFREEEKRNVESLYLVIGDEVLRDRVKTCLEWYIEKAAKYKIWFFIFSIASIVMPLIITVVNNIIIPTELSEEFLNTAVEAVGNTVVYSTGTAVWNKNMITICSVLASLSSSLLAFFKFQEKWILYRSTAETMKKELALYRAKQINNQCLEQLITELEDCMSKERAEWFLLSNENNGDKNIHKSEQMNGSEEIHEPNKSVE